MSLVERFDGDAEYDVPAIKPEPPEDMLASWKSSVGHLDLPVSRTLVMMGIVLLSLLSSLIFIVQCF
jgi:hypothetical protein